MSQTKTAHFDHAAATWDEKPSRITVMKAVGEAILQEVQLTKSMNVLDYGCGTGLLGLFLLPHVASVTGADNSTGMLEVLQKKIGDGRFGNMKTVLLDLEHDPVPADRYHAVVSSMALHHIADTEKILRAFYQLLQPGGVLGIADLDKEPGNFHDPDAADGVHHHGFNRLQLESLAARIGFTDSKTVIAHIIRKPVTGGTECDFPIFLLIAKK